MLLIGLDAESDRGKFGFAIGRLEHGMISIEASGLLAAKSADGISRIVEALTPASRGLIAVDAPLGWPTGLGDSLGTHKAGEPIEIAKHSMFRRVTDRRLREPACGGHQPLEVGADRIARAAHEALAVLGELRARSGLALPLVWEPGFAGVGVIEVYPAATLRAHGMTSRGYKKPEQSAVRGEIADRCAPVMPGLSPRCGRSADEFDACLCLLAAVDFLQSRCDPLPAALAQTAHREGWIWVRSCTSGAG